MPVLIRLDRGSQIAQQNLQAQGHYLEVFEELPIFRTSCEQKPRAPGSSSLEGAWVQQLRVERAEQKGYCRTGREPVFGGGGSVYSLSSLKLR